MAGDRSEPPTRPSAWIQGASRGLGLAWAETLAERGFDRVYATSRRADRSDALAGLSTRHPESLRVVACDVGDEVSIRRAVARISEESPRLHLVVNCAGVLHGEGLQPEKRLEHVDPDALAASFRVNAIGPLLVAKHALPLLRHPERAVLANVSARVGSIGDNRLGGWYGYRASKAAQNMLTRTLSLELARRAPNVVCVALHPGTVETALSEPFRKRGARPGTFAPRRAAEQLLDVLAGLGPADSGSFRAWDGSPIPW